MAFDGEKKFRRGTAIVKHPSPEMHYSKFKQIHYLVCSTDVRILNLFFASLLDGSRVVIKGSFESCFFMCFYKLKFKLPGNIPKILG